MEINTTTESILLCKKCLEKGEYIIPLFQKNEKTNEIEYKCSKKHSIGINDVINKKINEELISKLSKCEIHQENYCGWSEGLEKNLCFYEIGENLVKKEKYLLFMDIYPNITSREEYYFKLIDSLKGLLNEYLNDVPEAIEDITYLKNLIIIIDNSFNMFCKHKIHNYQVITNMIYSLSIIPSEEEIEFLRKKYLMYVYGDFLIEITKKGKKDINVKQFNYKCDKYDEIIPFIGKKKEKFFLTLSKKNNSTILFINEIKENNVINTKISKNYYRLDIVKSEIIIPYNEKMIIILNYKRLFFINWVNNESHQLTLEHLLINNNNQNNNIINFHHINMNNHYFNNNNFDFDDLDLDNNDLNNDNNDNLNLDINDNNINNNFNNNNLNNRINNNHNNRINNNFNNNNLNNRINNNQNNRINNNLNNNQNDRINNNFNNNNQNNRINNNFNNNNQNNRNNNNFNNNNQNNNIINNNHNNNIINNNFVNLNHIDFYHDYNNFEQKISALIKINSNDILLLYKNNVYIITLNGLFNSIDKFSKLKDVEDVLHASFIYYKKII